MGLGVKAACHSLMVCMCLRLHIRASCVGMWGALRPLPKPTTTIHSTSFPRSCDLSYDYVKINAEYTT